MAGAAIARAWLLLCVGCGCVYGGLALVNSEGSAGSAGRAASRGALKAHTTLGVANAGMSHVQVDAAGRIAPLGIRRERAVAPSRTSSLALVVARCNEALTWLPQFWATVPSDFRLTHVHIVEKCRGEEDGSLDESRFGACNSADVVAELDELMLNSLRADQGPVRGNMLPRIEVSCQRNVGLATYAYIDHIVSRYDQLEDYTVFMGARGPSQPSNASKGIHGYDLCDAPRFLELARQEGYASMGFAYLRNSGPSSLMSRLEEPLLGCEGKTASLLERGPTVNVRGNRFIASRGAIHHTSKAVYASIAACFMSLPLRHRPPDVSDKDWISLIPGHVQSVLFEESGHLLFGMPHMLPDQHVVPCGARRGHFEGYPAALSAREVPTVRHSGVEHKGPPWTLWRYLCMSWLCLMMFGQLGAMFGLIALAT